MTILTFYANLIHSTSPPIPLTPSTLTLPTARRLRRRPREGTQGRASARPPAPTVPQSPVHPRLGGTQHCAHAGSPVHDPRSPRHDRSVLPGLSNTELSLAESALDSIQLLPELRELLTLGVPSGDGFSDHHSPVRLCLLHFAAHEVPAAIAATRPALQPVLRVGAALPRAHCRGHRRSMRLGWPSRCVHSRGENGRSVFVHLW